MTAHLPGESHVITGPRAPGLVPSAARIRRNHHLESGLRGRGKRERCGSERNAEPNQESKHEVLLDDCTGFYHSIMRPLESTPAPIAARGRGESAKE